MADNGHERREGRRERRRRRRRGKEGLREGLKVDSSLTGQTGAEEQMSGVMDRMQVGLNWNQGVQPRQEEV